MTKSVESSNNVSTDGITPHHHVVDIIKDQNNGQHPEVKNRIFLKLQKLLARIFSSTGQTRSSAASTVQAQATKDTQPISILVVDDDATIRKTVSLHLTNQGHRVIQAKDGQEAINQLNRHFVELMLLDLRMPQMNGIEVLEIIRKSYNALELPVIMLTSCGESEDMVKALQTGANDYVIKSSEPSVLLARIETQYSLKTMNSALSAKKEDLQRGIISNKIAIEMAKAELEKEVDNRLEAEHALIQSETRFKILYDNTPTMCIVVDAGGEIVSVNRHGAHILGFKQSDLIDSSIFKTYHGEDGEKIRQYLIDVMDLPDRLHRWELRRLHKDGHVFWVRETAKRIKDMFDNPSILMVSVEIEEPKIN